jgi:hypothetical protein
MIKTIASLNTSEEKKTDVIITYILTVKTWVNGLLTCICLYMSTFWKQEEEIGALFFFFFLFIHSHLLFQSVRYRSHVSYLISFPFTLRALCPWPTISPPPPFIVHFVTHVHTYMHVTQRSWISSMYKGLFHINADEQEKERDEIQTEIFLLIKNKKKLFCAMIIL